MPDWAGDVSLGVAAWAGTDRSDDPAEARPRARHADGFGQARRGKGARGRRRTEGSAPPPRDKAMDPDADPESVARKILLDQLTGRARTRKELADKLAAKEVPGDVATALLDRFEEVGLIDDAAFARLWISSRQPGKGLARRALAQELRRKGIDDEVAREALDEIDSADEDAAARGLVRKKLRSLRNVPPEVATRRLVGMLARKGYGPGVAYRIVKEELQADPDEASDNLW
ncbi:regulatory protein RecX [Nocardioides alcanivorans]|uniref:regulatory protein RecX n=1 Tax=Nocardioides alcanivorans TaxID=2897352 RepID=UPI001F341D96|nr:regulatory protein RecX [Nocardioides alcanivorans]